MCGICGYVGRPETLPPEPAIKAMCDVIAHRGPDGDGVLQVRAGDGSGLAGWLGHRRLRIIDLSEHAHQPMTNEAGDVALVYNGETYNFRELRAELAARGFRFRSTGDTEVVLRAYEAWGDRFVERLDGMFAIAVWDARRGRLLLARDRTGKKPLFYAAEEDRVAFGSEIKSVLAAPWVNPEFAEELLPRFLTFGYVPAPETLYRGVRQVPPASTLTLDASGALETRTYWDPLASDVSARCDRPARRRIAELVENATARRLVADVPVGALLSGGVDSSVVVALMSRASQEPVRTFSIGFPDEPSYDERSYAKIVAERFGTRHVEFAVKADAVALMDTLLWHHDQPYADSSAIPTYLVCKLAREHVTVALNGDGGDEVFGGYDRFVAAKIAASFPQRAGRALSPLVRILPRSHGYYSIRRRAERFLELSSLGPLERYQSWIAVFNDDLLAALMPAGDTAELTTSMEVCYRRAAHLPVLDQILYANFKTYLPDDLAVKMDRMSMASSLETRSPFLDTALVEYLARFPATRKVGLRHVKPMLRRSLWPLLPREIWNRRKHGFGVPMGAWFRGELRSMFEDEVLATNARTSQYLDRAVLVDLWGQHLRGEVEHGFRFWTLLTLERWLRGLGSGRSARPSASTVSA
jgi:asparagine synthase (glutamine-hydrolysing)